MMKKCTCEHKFQDERYGKGMRVMTETGGEKQKGCRCTVCGKQYALSQQEK